jgi:hypothetical protein
VPGPGAGTPAERAPARRPNRSGRTAALLIVLGGALGGLGFGLWAGLTRKPPARAGAPDSGIPMEGLGVRHPPKPTAAPPPGVTPPPVVAAPPPAAQTPPPPADQRQPGQTLREIQALIAAEKISAARAVAERFLKTTPTGPEAEEIMGLTGVHPHP